MLTQDRAWWANWEGMIHPQALIINVCPSLSLASPAPSPAPRKPLRKEENGTSAAEYPMTSSQGSKGVAVNSAVV